jgi:hypothetical protein
MLKQAFSSPDVGVPRFYFMATMPEFEQLHCILIVNRSLVRLRLDWWLSTPRYVKYIVFISEYHAFNRGPRHQNCLCYVSADMWLDLANAKVDVASDKQVMRDSSKVTPVIYLISHHNPDRLPPLIIA